MGENGHYQLIAALRPFVHEEESRIESFLEEDLEWFVEAIEAFGVEDLMMQYIKRNPNATTQGLYHYFSDNTGDCPPGQEDIWEDNERE